MRYSNDTHSTAHDHPMSRRVGASISTVDGGARAFKMQARVRLHSKISALHLVIGNL